MSVVLSDRKLTCWMCGETGHFFSSCKEKKASEFRVPACVNPILDGSIISVSSLMGTPKTGVVKLRLSLFRGPRSPKRLYSPIVYLRSMVNGKSSVRSNGNSRQRYTVTTTNKGTNSFTSSAGSKGNAPDNYAEKFT